jgi:hypothetical protein
MWMLTEINPRISSSHYMSRLSRENMESVFVISNRFLMLSLSVRATLLVGTQFLLIQKWIIITEYNQLPDSVLRINSHSANHKKHKTKSKAE